MVNFNKLGKKAGRAVKGRYFKGKGYAAPKIGRMLKDISYLKTVINPEKKYLDTRVISAWSNLYPDSPMITSFNLTSIVQGDAANQRNGNSIKLASIHLNFDVGQDTNTSQSSYYKIYVVRYKGLQDTPANVQPRFLAVNPITGLRDYSAPRNIEHMHDFTVIKTFSGLLKADGVTNEAPIKIHEFHKNDQTHVRWDSAHLLQEGEIYIFGVSSFGADVSDNGLRFRLSARVFYYDN